MAEPHLMRAKRRGSVLIFAVLTALATAFIFYNSLQDSRASNDASGFFLVLIQPITEFFDGLIDGLDWNYIIRKGAHFTEFCMLGAFAANTSVCIEKRYSKDILGYCFFYTLSVAVADEYIQSFSDRTSSVSDVLIDMSGSLVGIFAVIVFRKLICFKKS